MSLIAGEPMDLKANFDFAVESARKGWVVPTDLGFSPKLITALQAYGMDPTNTDYLQKAKQELAEQLGA